jgi:hypothetical protein
MSKAKRGQSYKEKGKQGFGKIALRKGYLIA